MAVFRVEKNRGYTVMSNHHLRNAELSLKAKGLLSMMLSLPEEWNYTTRGLAAICKEGTDCIGSALKELEKTGYIVRNRLRDNKGKIVDVEYVIYETPRKPDLAHPHKESPDTDYPDTENPDMDNPGLENQPQLNKDISSNYQQNTDLSNTDKSNPILSNPPTPWKQGWERIGWNPEKYIAKLFWRTSTMRFLRPIHRWTVNSWTRSRRSSLIQFALPGKRSAFPATTSRQR